MHIIPIDGPVVVFTVKDASTGEGEMTAGITFDEAVRGRVILRTFVNGVEKNSVRADLVNALSMQSDSFKAIVPPGELVTVACLADFYSSSGKYEGQSGTETPFSSKYSSL